VIGGELNLSNSPSLIVLARQVNGNVETVLDTRGALLAGVAAGVISGVFYLLTSMLRGPRD
jgi:hypothetical protein